MNIALKNAIFGGLILGIIEGVGVVFTALQTRNRVKEMEEMQRQQMEMYRQMGMNMPGAKGPEQRDPDSSSYMTDKYADLSNLAP